VICARYLARPEEMRNVYHVSVGKFQKKRQLGRFRLKGEYNIKIDLYEVGCRHRTLPLLFRIGNGKGDVRVPLSVMKCRCILAIIFRLSKVPTL
jgi:hypothetical protein